MDQLTMDFSKTHEIENNPESDQNYLEHLEKFNRQNRIVFEQLMTGRCLTVREAMIHLNINSLPRRVKDLRDLHGVPVRDRWSTNGHYKEYFLEQEFINNYPNNG